MSEFQELIKSFAKSREYVRDFFVYGFKTRDDFTGWSTRTYDNERRRIESWLHAHVRQDYTEKGKNIYLSIDSNLLQANPLYRVWKAKSFTDLDIMLHFYISDYLKTMGAQTAEAITDGLLEQYDVVFDVQQVRRKCNEYVKEGLLTKEKSGKKILYNLEQSTRDMMLASPELTDAIKLFQLTSPLGIIGDTILNNLSVKNDIFRVKHSFFVHTLEDEILLSLLEAIKKESNITITVKSTRSDNQMEQSVTPLAIFVSTRTGRRYLRFYEAEKQLFSCARLDAIKEVEINDPCAKYAQLRDKETESRSLMWGVSSQSKEHPTPSHIRMTLRINEQTEDYVRNRLEREGKSGKVTRIAENTFTYEANVYNVHEMLPWIRTFTGRIIELTCDDKKVEQLFKQDMHTMYQIYFEE